jgi:hypothetical protein
MRSPFRRTTQRRILRLIRMSMVVGVPSLALTGSLTLDSVDPPRAAAVETVFDPTTSGWQGTEAGTDSVLDLIDSTGATALRLQVTMGDPLDKLDYVIDGAEKRGISPILTPAGPFPENDARYVPPAPGLGRYLAFVHKLGARYPEVRRWAIWNEPNLWKYFPLPRGLRHGRVGQRYRQLLLAAERALARTGHPRRQIMIGETSPKVTSQFIRDTFCLDRRWHRLHGCRPIQAAGWAHHPYIAARRPWLKSKLIGTGDLPRLHYYLARVHRGRGTPRTLPIYVTEFGVRDNQPDQKGLGPASEWVMTRHRWVRSFAQYSINYDWFGAGFLDADGRLEQGKFSSFVNTLFVFRRGHAVTVWGHLRNNPGGMAQLNYYDPDGLTGTLAIQTDSGGYFQQSVPWRAGRAWSLNDAPAVRTYVLPSR